MKKKILIIVVIIFVIIVSYLTALILQINSAQKVASKIFYAINEDKFDMIYNNYVSINQKNQINKQTILNYLKSLIETEIEGIHIKFIRFVGHLKIKEVVFSIGIAYKEGLKTKSNGYGIGLIYKVCIYKDGNNWKIFIPID